LVEQRWSEVPAAERVIAERSDLLTPPLPSAKALERLLSVCYHASLRHDEGRPVTFRIVFAEPTIFPAPAGPPTGMHRLILSPARPFDAHELQRLAAAAAFYRSLIGVRMSSCDELEVWGLVHSGPRWLQAVRGGRHIKQAIPAVLMVAVTGPGRVLVSKGTTTLAALADGTLADVATDVFSASWLAEMFVGLHAAQLPEQAALPQEPRTELDPAFGPQLAQHVLRRIVSTVRGARHGGALILLPSQHASAWISDGRLLRLKYQFFDEEPRRRVLSLAIQIMDALASRPRSHAELGKLADWDDYEESTDPRLSALDAELFEVAHLVAALADVDGAVVMTDQLEILGFGAEISGELPEVESVARSLDLEGSQRISERTERVGTRHRSSYRLCQRLHDALVIVVSQDGGVRFVRWHAGSVTYFDQIATGPWEV
jgi:hypothetical protein